jgi:hypothetical protein
MNSLSFTYNKQLPQTLHSFLKVIMQRKSIICSTVVFNMAALWPLKDSLSNNVQRSRVSVQLDSQLQSHISEPARSGEGEGECGALPPPSNN